MERKTVSDPFIVAIDGPSGSGKSSTARQVAQTLGFDYLDTGATYRAVTWALLEEGIDVQDETAVAVAADQVVVEVGIDPQGPTISANGVDVAGPIRGDAVTAAVSPVSAVPQVRSQLVDLQRATIAQSEHGIVVEGRDVGTVVAPDAPVKVFLVADASARATRRAAELGADDTEATQKSLLQRDEIDSTRATGPLARAEDAVQIDGTNLTLDEVVAAIVNLVKDRR